MAAAARRRLASFVRAAVAVTQDSPFFLHSDHSFTSPTTIQRSLFSSWLEDNPSSHHSCQFTFGLAHFSLGSSSHGPARFIEGAPGPDYSIRQNSISGSDYASQFLASQDIGLLSSLCISHGKSDKQISTSRAVSAPTDAKETNSSKVHQSFWSSQEVLNLPNAISLGRLLSGPLLGWLIMEGFLQSAVIGLIIAGASDWFDGYIARRQGVDSVFGTYLDPLADKVLIGCVAFSMAHGGYLPWALVALVIARDAVLIGGSLMLQLQNRKFQVSTSKDLFNFTKGRAQRIEPLYISKVNTVVQLALVAVALIQPAYGIEDSYALVPLLSLCAACTTCGSFMGYGLKLLRQRQ